MGCYERCKRHSKSRCFGLCSDARKLWRFDQYLVVLAVRWAQLSVCPGVSLNCGAQADDFVVDCSIGNGLNAATSTCIFLLGEIPRSRTVHWDSKLDHPL